MIDRFEILLRRIRRWLSRSEWVVRLLGLSRSIQPKTEPGLVMIQVDGLSNKQLKQALVAGNMPFLQSLLTREHYHLHDFYSGLPSSTPAVQAELFYGVKNAVPAFSFIKRSSGEILRMYDPTTATEIEQILKQKGEPLLSGGSSYSDNFTGGAQESHFCPVSLGWGPALRKANPFILIFFIASNIYSFIRVSILLAVEFFLAIIDTIRGVIKGHTFLQELKFVPTRVAICILLRELVTIGTKMDIARGLPIIHLNLLGYDEQAHRRGPDSKFAHWALKGIDDAISRIWHAARNASRREYDIWIYSDHGQERTLPYPKHHGYTAEQAIAKIFEQLESKRASIHSNGGLGIQSQRVRLLGGKRIQKFFARHEQTDTVPTDELQLAVTAMGPVGFINYSRPLTDDEIPVIARQLVNTANIPIVLRSVDEHRLQAWTANGEYSLPGDAADVLGSGHPFLEDVTDDLIALCAHPDAGDLVFCGWRYDDMPYTFPNENGSHAGPGVNETHAFALLPNDTSLPERKQDYLRPIDIRHAALHLLGRTEIEQLEEPLLKDHERRTLRVMTYNVHSCIGMDGKLSPKRIARLIALHDPDIVCLQELDVGRARTGGVDQALRIAEYLEMDFHFHPSIHMEEERYGDAILTHLPVRLVKAGKLPGLPHKPGLEPRGAVWIAVDVGAQEIQVINTHLGLLPSERKRQVEALLGPEWLQHPECHDPVILCGDFNAMPSSPVCRKLNVHLRDAQIELDEHQPRSTFFGRYPTARIDHVYVDANTKVLNIEVAESKLARVASDHLPLIVEIKISRKHQQQAA